MVAGPSYLLGCDADFEEVVLEFASELVAKSSDTELICDLESIEQELHGCLIVLQRLGGRDCLVDPTSEHPLKHPANGLLITPLKNDDFCLAHDQLLAKDGGEVREQSLRDCEHKIQVRPTADIDVHRCTMRQPEYSQLDTMPSIIF